MSKKIEIELDEQGKGTVRINGEPIPQVQEVVIRAHAGKQPEVWMRLVTRVEGEVTVKSIDSGNVSSFPLAVPVEVCLRQIHDSIKGLHETRTVKALG